MTADNVTKLPTLSAGAKAMAIVPGNFDDVYRMAKLMAASGLVPRDYNNKPEACAVAIMQGLEVGLSPLAAIQSIAVINGRPCLWGDGALAVVRASGLCEYIDEQVTDTEAVCTVKRRGEPEPVTRRFSMADAKRAKLAGKTGPWIDYPQRMLQMRARSWALRDVFADVLKGMGVAEEVRDMKDITPTPKSSAEAKRDGTSEIFHEINRHIAGAGTVDDMKFLRETYAEEWGSMPVRWKQLLDDAAALRMQEMGAEEVLICEVLGVSTAEASDGKA